MGNEQPYNVPDNWVWVRLIDGFSECLDNLRKPINATERATRQGNIPYYGATGQVGWIDNYLTNEHLVLVGEDGAPFLELIKDKAYIIEGKAWVNNHAHILRSFFGITGNVYMAHYLNILDFSGYVNGTTRLKLTQASMKTIPIPLPPLEEQQRIISRIESLFDKLDRAKKLVKSALDSFENRKAAILHNAFTGELTTKWREENGVSLDSWKKTTLEQHVSLLGDGIHGTPEYCESGDYYFINGNNLAGKFINIKAETKKVNAFEYQKHKKTLNSSTVLVSINGTLGKTAFYNNEPVMLGKSACYFNVQTSLNKHFIRYYLETRSFLNYAHLTATGSTIKNLSLKAMRNLELSLPSITEQKEIVHILDILLENETEAHELSNTIEKINHMKKSILARAFRGELGTNNPSERSAVEILINGGN